ncbi:MAG: DUF3243 domain-containing protein [Nitrospirae bacterium]|nr:DUF3243 domain-containing protein [Nitrospirota bacterium]
MATETMTKCVEKMDFMKDWQNFRKTLHEGISAAKQFGASDDEIQEMAVQVGHFLNEKVCPSSKEEELLKEMWDVSSSDERKVLAQILFKMLK